jgi:hypothetical protein
MRLVQFTVSLSDKIDICMYTYIYIHTYILHIPNSIHERLNHISLGLISPVMRLLMQPLGRMICLQRQRQRGFHFLSFPSVRFLLELARWMEPYRPMLNGRMRSPVPVMARTASASASAAWHCKCLPSDAMRSTLCSCEMRSNHRHRRNVFEQSRFEMLCGAWKRSE